MMLKIDELSTEILPFLLFYKTDFYLALGITHFA